MWQAQIFTLYPDFFPGPLNKGLYGKALTNKIWDLKVVNIREAAEDKHKTVDDTPFGGGSGMLLKADILAKSLDENKKEGERIFYLSPKGKKLDQKLALELSKEKSISLICGHFEGVDERLLSTRNIEELSIGDFILSGGETAAFVVLDSVLRLLPGVLGNEHSKTDESFENGLLEYPQYTRPQTWIDAQEIKHEVPEILLSGHHEKIKQWRINMSIKKTKKNRPDLLEKKKKEQE
jgi:tRNA (guanine37-N1)-methyltransferase